MVVFDTSGRSLCNHCKGVVRGTAQKCLTTFFTFVSPTVWRHCCESMSRHETPPPDPCMELSLLLASFYCPSSCHVPFIWSNSMFLVIWNMEVAQSHSLAGAAKSQCWQAGPMIFYLPILIECFAIWLEGEDTLKKTSIGHMKQKEKFVRFI